MSVIHQLNPFGESTIAFYVFCFFLGIMLSRFATWLSRRIRTHQPRTFRFQHKIPNLYQIATPEFTMVCGPRQNHSYTKYVDYVQMDRFLRKLFPNHTTKLPTNIISVWIPRKNFKTGRGFQEFEPIDGKTRGAWFSYRMVCDRVQETLYNYKGKRYMAGMCIYMRTTDEWWWWAPAIERNTVENAFKRGPVYTPETEQVLVVQEPPKYEDIENDKEPPSYTSLLMEKENGEEDGEGANVV